MDDLNLRASEIPWVYAVNQINKAVTDFQDQLEKSGSEEDLKRSAEIEKCWQRIMQG
jgi:hypothetical protein